LIVANLCRNERLILFVTKQNDGCILKIAINSMVDDDLEVRRASLKALESVLHSTDAQLMATIVDFGYLDNISTAVISANDEVLLKNALFGLSNFVTSEPSIKQFLQ
jgi:hypothetical protein